MDVVFIDTETTSLHPDTGEIWEFAGIRRDMETGEDWTRVFHIETLNMADADPFSLKIGGYYDRHGHYAWASDTPPRNPNFPNGKNPVQIWDRAKAAKEIHRFTFGATLVVNVPTFDEPRLDRLLRSENYLPAWHYHVLDMESMIVGYAAAKGYRFPLPYSSDDLNEWLGVEPPSDEDRHTALGDARWVRRQWDAIYEDSEPTG